MSRSSTNDSGTGRNKHLSVSITILIIIAIIATAVISVYISQALMGNVIDNETKSVANASVKILVNEMLSLQEKSELAADAISSNQQIISAVQQNAEAEVSAGIATITKNKGFDDVIITDRTGIVLYSLGGIIKSGTDIKDHANIKAAGFGINFSGTVSNTYYRFAIAGSAPIYGSDGKIIGTATALYSLENPVILDNLKKETGNEYTIFVGNERLNTTIIQNGKRVIGTKLNDTITKIVINDMDSYLGNADILGEKYATAYVPIFSDDGNSVIGVLFSGINLTTIIRSENQAQVITLSACFGLIVIFSVISLVFLKRRLSVPLKKVVECAQAIETGTMSKQTKELLDSINSKDEIGRLAISMDKAMQSIEKVIADVKVLNDAAARNDLTIQIKADKHTGKYKDVIMLTGSLFNELATVIKEINQAAAQTLHSSHLISDGSMVMAQGATEQAAAIEEISATVNQFSVQARKTSEIAVASNNTITKVQKETELGNEKMKRLLTALNEIDNASTDISSIIKTIEDIAFQTNILALNAAVEAARAGANGKGFAVVATEVKSLAEKSTKAAQQTNQLISDSMRKSKEGAVIGKDMNATLGIIVEGISETAAAINIIADESMKQTSAIEQLNAGLDQISQVVNNNSATAQESASSSLEMTNQAQNLNAMVSMYKIG